MIKRNSLGVCTATALIFIKCYQNFISPLFGGRAVCRFTPSCSEYTRQAIEKYGCWRGIRMGFRRILQCRPGGGYGYDPVP